MHPLFRVNFSTVFFFFAGSFRTAGVSGCISCRDKLPGNKGRILSAVLDGFIHTLWLARTIFVDKL